MKRYPIYLDYAATTPVDLLVQKKMNEYLTWDGQFGNPSSHFHSYGWQAQKAVEVARVQIAELIDAQPQEIIFTSGATEGNNLAIKGTAQFYQQQGKHLISCATEHTSVLQTLSYLQKQGFDITLIKPEPNGLLDLNKLKEAIRSDTILISIMHVNNEIGVVQDIETIADIAWQHNIFFHVDATQSVDKIPINLASSHIDLLTLSAHKMYGPKGIGALYINNKSQINLIPQLHGSSQELGFRSGTLPTHQIAGFGEACAIALENRTVENERLLKLRQRLWDNIQHLPFIYLNGDLEKRIPGNLNISFGGIQSETIIDSIRNKFAVSSGSACHTAQLEPSHVLKAIGRNDSLAQNALRFSLGRYTTQEDIDELIKTILS